MFSKELEALIQSALVDGQLDETEKRALMKRAEKENVDLDELEVYINSEMQKRIKQKQKEQHALEDALNQKKKEVVGKVCPHCGQPVPPLAETCPSCGSVILTAAVDAKIENMIKEVRKLFALAESSVADKYGRVEKNTKAKSLGYCREAKTILLELQTYYSTVPKVSTFVSIVKPDLDAFETKTRKRLSDDAKMGIGIGVGVIFLLILSFFL